MGKKYYSLQNRARKPDQAIISAIGQEQYNADRRIADEAEGQGVEEVLREEGNEGH